MEHLGSLYHWAPSDRRTTILREGLVPGSKSTISSEEVSYVSLGPSPRRAWTYSGDLSWASELENWDLWQVTLSDTDDCRVRTDYGTTVIEVRAHNVIPPDRVWFVGQRKPWLTC